MIYSFTKNFSLFKGALRNLGACVYLFSIHSYIMNGFFSLFLLQNLPSLQKEGLELIIYR